MQFDIQPIENIVAKFAEAYKQQLISDGKKATGNLIRVSVLPESRTNAYIP